MKEKMLIGLGVFLVLCAGAYVLVRSNTGHMNFPRAAHGTFIELPHLVTEAGKSYIQWTMPERCARNGYEIQETEYREGRYWGGQENVPCEAVGGAYRCRGDVLNEVSGVPGKWNVQASGHECGNDRTYFVSEVNRI